MAESGIITAYDLTSNIVTIEFNARGACKSCGMCLAGSGKDLSKMTIKALNSLNAKIGDTVEFEVKEGEMLKASMLLYGFPMAMLLIGFVFGRKVAQLMFWSLDLISLLFAGIFFFGAFYMLSVLEKSKKQNDHEHIRLLRIA